MPSVQCRKVWLRPLQECRAVTLPRRQDGNPLKFAGVPQTPELISAVSGPPKFTILRGHVEEVLLHNNLFRLSIHALVAKIQPDKIVQWCRDGDDGAEMAIFLRQFCVLYFQRAACSTFQTCILNSHQGHTMCRKSRSMVDIHHATADIRRGKAKKEEQTKGQKYNGMPY